MLIVEIAAGVVLGGIALVALMWIVALVVAIPCAIISKLLG